MSEAAVSVGGREVARISRGIVALVGIEQTDQPADRAWTADKLVHLRIFEDAAGKMNLGLTELGEGAGMLLVPNFTLAGDARKGRRPSFDHAMRPESAEPEFARLAADIRGLAPGLVVQTGVFRADMQVSIVNDGPVTIVLDSVSSR